MIEPESPESGSYSYFLSQFHLQRAEEFSFANVMEDDRILKSNIRFLQQCTVCGSDTFNSFYGAICCDPCRTFFRRHALTQKSFTCKKDKNCPIIFVKGTRPCRWCRYQRCLSAGMRPDLIDQYVAIKLKKIQRLESLQTRQTKKGRRVNMNQQDLRNEPLSLSCLLPLKPQLVNVAWLKKDPNFSLNYQVINVSGVPCDWYQITIQLEDEEDIRLIESSKRCSEIEIYNDSLSLSLKTRDGLQVFCRESQSLFNVYVSTQSSQESSIIIMESLTDDHWFRMKDIISASLSFEKINIIGLDVDYSKDKTVSFTFARHLSMNYISKGMESLTFFQKLCLEDQIIIIKETTFLVVLLVASHSYVKESESFVIKTPLKDHISFCLHKNRFLSISNGQRMHEFSTQFIETFYDFLLKDTFVIILLSILCILEDRPGLSCTETLDYERKLHLQILDQYIKAKVITEEWPLDRELIWKHIYQMRDQVEKYGSIRLRYIKEQEEAHVLNSVHITQLQKTSP